MTLADLVLSVRALVALQLHLDHMTQSPALVANYLHHIIKQRCVASLSSHEEALAILTHVSFYKK